MSSSAAICADLSPDLVVGRGDCLFQLLLNLESLRSCSMFPHCRSLIRCDIVFRMLSWLRFCSSVGARISLSILKSSHQKMSAWLVDVDLMMRCIILASSELKRTRLFLLRYRRHVERKCGGSLW